MLGHIQFDLKAKRSILKQQKCKQDWRGVRVKKVVCVRKKMQIDAYRLIAKGYYLFGASGEEGV